MWQPLTDLPVYWCARKTRKKDSMADRRINGIGSQMAVSPANTVLKVYQKNPLFTNLGWARPETDGWTPLLALGPSGMTIEADQGVPVSARSKC
jgi:hypothetical protein